MLCLPVKKTVHSNRYYPLLTLNVPNASRAITIIQTMQKDKTT